ncbi:MAG: hypothetical protein U9P73_07910 [Candidatus Cloacimonadota bacterium]|nr:hypothetical protein [Candidatus Cloacimonadota bacterium]
MFEKRRSEMREKGSSTWINFIVRILALIFIVMIIRYFSDSDPEKFRSWINFTSPDSVQVQENK